MAATVDYSNGTTTITLDANEHLSTITFTSEQLSATQVVVKTNTSDLETISNLTMLNDQDFSALSTKFTSMTSLDIHGVNYLFNLISLSSDKLQYVRMRDNIKNIQPAWFTGSSFVGAYSYCGTTSTAAVKDKSTYSMCFKNTAGQLENNYKALAQTFKFSDGDAHQLNTDQNAVYATVTGALNAQDIDWFKNTSHLTSLALNIGSASYVGSDGTSTDYANLSFNGIGNKLVSIVLPSNMDVVGNGCFNNCTSLAAVNIPDGVTSIGDQAFNLCTGITAVNIPEGCTSIGKEAFLNCCLQGVLLPRSLENISERAFVGNKYLTRITFPNPLKTLTLGDRVFEDCPAMRDVYLMGKAPSASANTFDNTQCGQNAKQLNGTETGVTFDYFYDKDQTSPLLLHYTEAAKEHCVGTEASRENYSITGADGKKYPKGEEGKNYYNTYSNNTGQDFWKKFVFAEEYSDPDIDIPRLKEDRWYTICFPFNMNRTQIENTFGSGTQLCSFQYVEKEDYTDERGDYVIYTIRFNNDLIKQGLNADGTPRTPGTEVVAKADTPYMIHPSQKADTHTTAKTWDGKSTQYYRFTDGDRTDPVTQKKVTFETDGHTAGTVRSEASKAVIGTGNIITTPEHVVASFVGNYADNTLIPYGHFFLGGGEFYKIESSKDQSRTTGKWSRFSAIVKIEDATFDADKYIQSLKNTAGAKYAMPAEWGDDPVYLFSGTTTDIAEIKVPKRVDSHLDKAVYNLNGQKVADSLAAANPLPKGIYVVAGKKIIVK